MALEVRLKLMMLDNVMVIAIEISESRVVRKLG